MKNKDIKLVILLFVIVLPVVLFSKSPLVSAAKNSSDVILNSYSATITWVTDKPSTSQIEYGINTSYNTITPLDTNLVTYHKVTVSSLTPSTLYHYRIRSKDAYGNEALSGDLKFVTLKEPPRDRPPQISDVEAESIVATGAVGQVEKKSTPAQEAGQSATAQEASQLVKKEEPIEKALIQKGGVLLRKGKLQIEPSFTYAHVSANRIAISGYTIFPVLVVGEINSEEVKRDIFIQSLACRYGLKNDLQVELRVPFRQQLERISVSTTSETTRSSSGLGDIEGGIFHQFAYEKGVMPDLVAGLSVKSNTGKEPYGRDIGLGTGHWAIKGSLVAVKSSDPAILFSKLGYTYNIKRNDITDYGTVEPGQSFDYGLGIAFALNYQLAISLQLEQSLTTKMIINHQSVPSSFTNVANFKYGFTWSMSKNFSCDVSATHGLTTDAPNFALEVRFPYTF